MVLWIYIRLCLLLHICKHVKSQLAKHTRNTTKSCIGPKGSNGKVIPFYGYGRMDECGWCFVKNNVKVYCDMLTRNWAI
jgi:hypothetical protein